MKIKQLLLTAFCAVMSVGAWAEEGDVTTNVNIDFSNAIVDGAIAGTKGSMTIGSGSGAAARVEGGWLRQGDVTNVVTIPEAERAGSKDVVTVSFKMAWGNKNGMGSSFALKDANGVVICSLSHCRWGSSTNSLNVDLGGLVGSAYNNAPILDRNTQFTITIDYAAKTIQTVVKCANPNASQTFNATLSNTNPVATFETAGFNVGGNTDRADALDDLLITTTEGNYNAATHAYTVKAVCGVVELQALDSGTAGEGEGYSVSGLPYVIVKDGVYYILSDANTTNFSKDFVMETADANVQVNYALDNSIVAFTELGSGENAAYTNGGYTVSNSKLATVNLDPGIYQAEIKVISNGSSGKNHRTEGVYVGGNLVGATDNGDRLFTFKFGVTEDNTEAYVQGRGSSNYSDNLDYVLIRKIADLPNAGDDITTTVVNPNIEGNANGWTWELFNGGNGPLQSATGNNNFEYWAGSATNRDEAGFDYYQTINGLPNGYYIVSAEMYNSLNSETGAEFNQSCGVYANSEIAYVTVEGNTLNRYTTAPVLVTDGTLRIGVKSDKRMGARWFVADNFQLTYLGDASATMTVNATAKYGTFCAPFAVDVPAAVEASTATLDGQTIVLASVGATIPANTPVILYGEDLAENLSQTFYGQAVAGTPTAGVLTGTYSQIAAPNGSYILQNHDDEGVGFYQVNTDEATPNVPANRCYLTVGGGANVRAFFFDAETAISAIEALTSGKAEIYNLNGVKLNSLQKGINIVNGKKIMVK